VPVFSSRAWTDEQWAAAQNRLVERGWLNPDGTATALGRAERDEIERVTDALAAAPWRAIGPAAGRLAQLAGPMTMTVAQSGLLPQESTLGIRR
jgi:hypothetical protein